ncbi:porin family protein [Spirosoma gilvum]
MNTRLAQIVILSLFISSATYGQGKARFGVTAGLNAAQIQTSLSLDKPLWRYNAGVAFEQQFFRKFVLASELIYSRQGASEKYTGPFGQSDDRIIYAFDYLALPVLLRIRPVGERAFIQAGGQIGYLLTARNYFASKEDQALTYQHTKSIDAGLIGGVGYRLGQHFVVDGRYYYGMNPLREDYTAPDPQSGITKVYHVEKWYNRVWSVNLAYYF